MITVASYKLFSIHHFVEYDLECTIKQGEVDFRKSSKTVIHKPGWHLHLYSYCIGPGFFLNFFSGNFYLLPSCYQRVRCSSHHSCSSGDGMRPAVPFLVFSSLPCHQLWSSLDMIWMMSPTRKRMPASLQGMSSSLEGSYSNWALT